MKNQISFRVWGKYALFTDPITRTGGEKFSYQIPTYEAIKGILKSIYWKPTLVWQVDKVRVMKPIRTRTRSVKPLKWSGGNDLANYTFLNDVEYQVQAHFKWNLHRPELKADRIDGKHFAIAKRCLDKGGRQDIFLGVRDCQGYVEPCDFGEDISPYDDLDQLDFGVIFHSFGYPDETGDEQLVSRLWRPRMVNGVVEFIPPEQCDIVEAVRPMTAKKFTLDENHSSVDITEAAL